VLQRTRRPDLEPSQAGPRPLLPRAVRPLAAWLLVGCVAVTAFLGAWSAHQSRAGWLDRSVDARVQASLGSQRAFLSHVVLLGDPRTVTVITTVLFLACLVARRWRGAVLLAIAVPAAAALTEVLLKPLIDRTMAGALSFPSGHATGIFTLAAAVGVLLLDPSRPRLLPALRVLLALIAYAAAGGVAVALVVLGFHYFTDTVGGAAAGTAVVLATAFLLDWLGLRRPWRPSRETSAG